MVLREYISTLEIKNTVNVFKDRRYDLNVVETCTFHSLHKVDKVSILFEDGSAVIKFAFKDFITASYIYTIIVTNKYGYDDHVKCVFNNQTLTVSNDYETFNEIIKLKDFLTTYNYIKITFSKNESYEYHGQNIIFFVSPYHHDLYYYNIELKRIQ
jgi:hypothetical protein